MQIEFKVEDSFTVQSLESQTDGSQGVNQDFSSLSSPPFQCRCVSQTFGGFPTGLFVFALSTLANNGAERGNGETFNDIQGV